MTSAVVRTLFRRCIPSNTSRNIANSRLLATKSAADGTGSDRKNTHFGFETVSEEEKEEKVYEVFHNVAEKYDVMNDAMSGGIHRLWKDYFVQKLGPTAGMSLLDVAGGTGDIGFRYIEYIKNLTRNSLSEEDVNFDIPMSDTLGADINYQKNVDTVKSASIQGSINVTISDINQAMLDMGKKKAVQRGYTKGVSWLLANAEELPIEDNQYDAYTVAFGIRNMTHIDKVLAEAYRVVKPGGRFMCLEFSQVNNPILRRLYDEYSFQVIPVMGQVIAGDWHSYQYLVESIRKFPCQDDFAGMIREAGFKAVSFENLLMGVAAIHSGYKL